MSILSLSGIKYRAKPIAVQKYIGGFPDYEDMDISKATAEITSPTPTIIILPTAPNSTAIGISPSVSISVDISSISNATASSVAPSILNANPEPLASEATANITQPIPQIIITLPYANNDASIIAPTISINIPAQATANASSVASIPTIDISSVIADSSASVSTPIILVEKIVNAIPGEATASIDNITPSISVTSISNATASIVAPTVSITGGSTSDQLSFPEDMIDPLWAGNLSGQSYDDTMPVQITTVESASYSIGEAAIGES